MSKKYNTRAASKYLEDLGISATPGTLEVWRCKGRGPGFVKILGRIYYPQENLDNFATGTPVKTIDSMELQGVV